jgi:hypothetical protein
MQNKVYRKVPTPFNLERNQVNFLYKTIKAQNDFNMQSDLLNVRLPFWA